LIENALVNDLLSVHNDDWAAPGRNRPKLTREEFLQRLVPQTVDFGSWEEDDGSHERCSVKFDDSRMFGGHAIEVRWNPAESTISPSASIEG
jgi:hypothetical protein